MLVQAPIFNRSPDRGYTWHSNIYSQDGRLFGGAIVKEMPSRIYSSIELSLAIKHCVSWSISRVGKVYTPYYKL